MLTDEDLLQQVVALCGEAGDAILEVYNRVSGFEVDYKDDDSPVTAADLAAHKILDPGLKTLADLPVLSEESQIPDYETRRQWQRYWLVDPLDGTREFVSRNGEFTVNVALIEEGQSVLGVVYVPVTGVFYTGLRGRGARKIQEEQSQVIQTRSLSERLAAEQPPEIVVSRRGGTATLEQLSPRLHAKLGKCVTTDIGSSLKLCLVAEGAADFYPRLAPTSEWDTAAAQAVVEAAGGRVLDDALHPLRYNQKASLLNPSFYVLGDSDYDWRGILDPVDNPMA